MKSLARCAALLCVWVSVAAQDADIQAVFAKINDEVIRGTFSARVEVTRGTDNATKTYTITEYHDSSIGLHAIETTPLNTRTYFYKKGTGGQIATVDIDRKCTIDTAELAAGKPESFIYRSAHAVTPEYFLGPTAAIVDMSMDSFKWVGAPDEVRGIDATVYSSEERNDNSKRLIQVWFAASNWNVTRLSAKAIPFPLRILITDADIYDQFDFYQVQDLSAKEAFRLAEHLQLPFEARGCALLKSALEPVELLDTFSFTSSLNGIDTAREYFSRGERLYRADQDGGAVIHDDNHGLIYTIGSGCQVKPNPLVKRSILSLGSEAPGATAIQAYLRLPTKVYVGESFIRGMPVDVWDAVADDKDPDVDRARFFFTKPIGTPGAVNSANGVEGSRQLVKAWILNSGDNEPLDIDIFDFAGSTCSFDSKSIFNIEDCAEASMYVEFDFQADETFAIEEFKLSNAQHELLHRIEDNIKESVGVSPLQLRASKAEVLDGRNVKVFSKILSPPAYLNSFTTREGAFRHYDGEHTDSANVEDCARRCTLSSNCPTFLFCGKSTCQLRKDSNESTWGTPSSTDDCSAYDHVPLLDSAERRTLLNISDDLSSDVMSIWEPITVSMGDKQIVTLRATKFLDHLTQFDQQGTLGPYKLQYQEYSIRDEHESSVVANGKVSTVGQCYRECRNNKDIACSSFSICTDIQHCVLTSENINAGSSNDVDQPNTIQKTSKSCSIYSVNYLSEFDRLDGKSRRSGSMENAAGATAGDCAVKCRQGKLETLEECRSFDFCPKRKMCLFYRTHYNWDGGDDAFVSTDNCDHYALRYSASYTAIGKGAFDGKPATKVAGVSFEDCAKQCSERSNGACKTISYCDSDLPHQTKETCYLYSADITDLSDSNNNDKTCTIYTQLIAYNDDLINPKNGLDKETESSQIGMGDGAFAFLLIAMIAIGAVFGTVGWFQREKISSFIGRSGGASTSGTTISYNRQEEDNRTEA